MPSIIEELKRWAEINSSLLREHGIKIEEGYSEIAPAFLKGSISLESASTHVLYTVWERDVMLTDLIVFDIATKRTLVMNEHQPTEAIQATRDLDVIVGKLIAGDYVGAEPDPKLVIV